MPGPARVRRRLSHESEHSCHGASVAARPGVTVPGRGAARRGQPEPLTAAHGAIILDAAAAAAAWRPGPPRRRPGTASDGKRGGPGAAAAPGQAAH